MSEVRVCFPLLWHRHRWGSLGAPIRTWLGYGTGQLQICTRCGALRVVGA